MRRDEESSDPILSTRLFGRFPRRLAVFSDGLWAWQPETGTCHLSARTRRRIAAGPTAPLRELETWVATLCSVDRGRVRRLLERQALEGGPFRVVFDYVVDDHELLPTLLVGDTLRAPSGEVEWLVGAQYHLGEPTNASSDSDLDARTGHLHSFERERLIAYGGDLQDFVDRAAHDLQEPVRAVRAFTALLADELGERLSGEPAEYLHFVRTGADRLASMIADLGTLSRIGRTDHRVEPVDLEAMLRSAVDELIPADAEVSFDMPRSLPRVLGVASELEIACRALIDNARKFCGPDPLELTVTARHRDGRVITGIRDNGIGIPSDQRHEVWGIFRRLHPSTAYPGNGMGLALARRVAMVNGGALLMRSRHGAGTEFELTLPGWHGEPSPGG